MYEDNEIKNFEDLFVQPEPVESKPSVDKSKYWIALGSYFGMIYIGAVIILLFLLALFSNPYREISPEEQVVEAVVLEYNGVAFIGKDVYHELYENEYNRFLGKVEFTYESQTYYLLYNSNNQHAKDFLDLNEPVLTDLILQIADGTVRQWGQSGSEMVAISSDPATTSLILQDSNVVFDEVSLSYQPIVLGVTQIILQGIMITVVILLIKREVIFDWKAAVADGKQTAAAIGIGFLYTLAGVFAVAILSTILMTLFNVEVGTPKNQILIERMMQSNSMILMVISAVLLAPVLEELLFRKCLFGLFKTDKMALIVSTLVFALLHLDSEIIGLFSGTSTLSDIFISGLSYFVMGGVFGYIYIKNKKNVIVPIGVHLAYNALSILLILL